MEVKGDKRTYGHFSHLRLPNMCDCLSYNRLVIHVRHGMIKQMMTWTYRMESNSSRYFLKDCAPCHETLSQWEEWQTWAADCLIPNAGRDCPGDSRVASLLPRDRGQKGRWKEKSACRHKHIVIGRRKGWSMSAERWTLNVERWALEWRWQAKWQVNAGNHAPRPNCPQTP